MLVTPALYIATLLILPGVISGCDRSDRRHQQGVVVPVNPGMSALGSFDNALRICQGMRVSNAPKNNGKQLKRYAKTTVVNGVQLLTAPVKNACLSSGFGRRGKSMHKGVDYHQRPAGGVFAGADGVIVEAYHHRDFGNTILLQHSDTVFTRYAHLASFARPVVNGKKVRLGQRIATMGNTGRTRAVHLHYEILTGNYNNPKRSFGLTPHNPFNF